MNVVCRLWEHSGRSTTYRAKDAPSLARKKRVCSISVAFVSLFEVEAVYIVGRWRGQRCGTRMEKDTRGVESFSFVCLPYHYLLFFIARTRIKL